VHISVLRLVGIAFGGEIKIVFK